MAVDQFLKLGDIKGEAKDDTHGDEIKVLSWNWGLSQSGGTEGKGGKVDVKPLSVTKPVDCATPNLLMACCDGRTFDKALLTVRSASGDKVEYIKLELEKVKIRSLTTGGSQGETDLTETATLGFRKYKYVYTPTNDDGSAGAEVEKLWDIDLDKEV